MDMDKIINESRWVLPTPAIPCFSYTQNPKQKHPLTKRSLHVAMVTVPAKPWAAEKPMKKMGSLHSNQGAAGHILKVSTLPSTCTKSLQCTPKIQLPHIPPFLWISKELMLMRLYLSHLSTMHAFPLLSLVLVSLSQSIFHLSLHQAK